MGMRDKIEEIVNGKVKKSTLLEDVLIFRADMKYVVCYHRGGEILMNDTLDSLEAEFPDKFIRVHRSSLVAKSLIKPMRLTHEGLTMKIEGFNYPVVVAHRRRHLVDAIVNPLVGSGGSDIK